MGWDSARPIILLMPVSCILLAAGASRRLGQPKQLVRVGGETLLERSIRLALEAGCERVLVVLGARAREMADALDGGIASGAGVTLVVNEEWEQGIASSIRAGVLGLEQEQDALLMACDQATLAAEHLVLLLRAFAEHDGQRIAASRYSETLGIPAVFPRARFGDLLALDGDEGARRLLRRERQVVAVRCDEASLDVDTPEDLARLTERERQP